MEIEKRDKGARIKVNTIAINDRIRYIEASEDPLCADIGIIAGDHGTWLYDVGNGEKNIAGLNESYHVVLSHFHPDHVGNLGKIRTNEVFVSKETWKHVLQGTIVDKDLYIGDLHIFPIPSSHAKGCLGLEVEETYAFVGDALYCRMKDGFYIYNAQHLQEEIRVLENLKAQHLLVSHFKGLVRGKEEVLAELKEIYRKREKNEPEIRINCSTCYSADKSRTNHTSDTKNKIIYDKR